MAPGREGIRRFGTTFGTALGKGSTEGTGIILRLRLHALQALVGGVIGLAASAADLWLFLQAGRVPGRPPAVIAAPVLYVMAVALALADQRAAADAKTARLVKPGLLVIGLGSLVLSFFVVWSTLPGALHVAAAAILLSALMSTPRSGYDPTL